MPEDIQKVITIAPPAAKSLESYRRRHNLPSFGAVVEAAATAPEQQELRAGYEQFARNYPADEAAQAEAEAWLGLSMQETE